MIDWTKFGITPDTMSAKPRGMSTRDWALQSVSASFRALYKKVGAPRRNGGNQLVKDFLAATNPNPLARIISKLPSIWSTYLAWPTPPGYRTVVQGFATVYPYTAFFIQRGLAGKRHGALDIPCPTGTPVTSPGAGTVLLAEEYDGYGLTVIVQVGKHWCLHAHNSALKVKKGQQVTRGQVIALAGSTGFSTGSHVHFEVRVNGAKVDPLPLLR